MKILIVCMIAILSFVGCASSPKYKSNENLARGTSAPTDRKMMRTKVITGDVSTILSAAETVLKAEGYTIINYDTIDNIIYAEIMTQEKKTTSVQSVALGLVFGHRNGDTNVLMNLESININVLPGQQKGTSIVRINITDEVGTIDAPARYNELFNKITAESTKTTVSAN